MKRKKLLIDEYFDTWINDYPESYHWKDMKRFYGLVLAVCRFGRKPRNSNWLKDKINKSNHSLTEEDIEYYCNLFYRLQDFCKYKDKLKRSEEK